MSLNPIFFMTAILFVIPFITQLRNYYLTKSKMYAYFSLIFFVAVIGQFLNAIQPDNFVLQSLLSVTFVSTNFLLLMIAHQSNRNDMPIPDIIWKVYSGFAVIVLIYLKYLMFEVDFPAFINSLRFVVSEILRIMTGISLIVVFWKIKLVKASPRTNLIRKLWVISGITLLVKGLTKTLFYGALTIDTFLLSNAILGNLESVEAIVVLIDEIGILLIAVITFILGIFFPEVMLLSHHQLMMASKIYDLLEHEIDPNKVGLFEQLDTRESLIAYLSSLPVDMNNKNGLSE